MENILKTLKLSEAVLKGVVTFKELDTTQKHLIGHTLNMLNDSIVEIEQSHKLPVMRPASEGAVGGELLPAEGLAKGVRVDDEYTRGYKEGWRDCCNDVKEFG